jgi:hypothetical protein
MKTALQAQNTEIFVIEDNKVEKTNLYDFVMISASETTSPVGIMPHMHIRHEDYFCRYGRLNSVNNDEGHYEVWLWGHSGNGSTFVQEFETESEAEDFIFERTYLYDFEKDDQRDTCFYESYEEANEERIRLYAESNRIDLDVAESILKHEEIRDKMVAERKKLSDAIAKAAYEKGKEQINAMASNYKDLISKIEGESYKQTAGRLSNAIGERIESHIFHAAVKFIRK